jgi:hypothetical protein
MLKDACSALGSVVVRIFVFMDGDFIIELSLNKSVSLRDVTLIHAFMLGVSMTT